MKSILLVIVLIVTSITFGQNMEIKGRVMDTYGEKPVENSVIMAVRLSDSVLLGHTRSDADGYFDLEGVVIDTFELIVTHPNFSDKSYFIFGSEESSEINIPSVSMPDKAQEIAEVNIIANKESIYFKGDTMVYIADSFATRANANVEDLLKKLPGLKVNDDGSISSQGKNVSKVLVDGDEFFGSDPTVATRNLGADGVESVQVYEKKNDDAEDGEDETIQVMDLKLKEEAKKMRYNEETKGATDKIKSLERKTKSSDYQIISLLLGKEVRSPKYPTASTYLGTRYQDDANNPTNYGNRRMVNGPFPVSDLLSLGKTYGGPGQAAIGYIYTDLDAWPGWHNEWSPGNPNFHTDKYIASIYAAAAMQDHPHANEWLEFGLDNFNNDLKKVFIAPDGVGVECPGYAGFSMSLQLETGGAIFNSGLGNPFVANPLIKKNAIWHRKLITPYDKRIKRRHEAPIGDTHRWDSGMMKGFAHLAPFYKEEDPTFASEMMTSYKLLIDSGAKLKSHGMQEIFLTDSSIKAVSLELNSS